MKMTNKLGLSLLALLSSSFSLFAQNGFFNDVPESKISTGDAKRVLVPQKYRTVSASVSQLKSFLWSLPSEQNVTDRNATPVITLPMPGGTTARFHVWESSIQEPALQAKFSEIRTFLGQGIDDPYATVRLDFNPYFGFHAQVLSPNGNVYIDPYARGNINYYISYNSIDNIRQTNFHCEVTEPETAGKGETIMAGPCRGTQLYTYRLAVACTGEYAAAVGGTTAANLHAAIVTTVNRVVGVYEQEIAVRLVLVANNNTIEFLDANTDPFAGNNNANTLINESQTVITNALGSANFDIGHTFSTGGGGLAGLGVVCSNGQKAAGITGNTFPVGDSYDIDYVAHEMGHQFGGSHTFNSVTSNCGGGNRSSNQAYEVGSGTTIQAYAGICGNDNIQPNSDPYFHAISFDQISNFLEAGGAGCRTVSNTGNTLPVITSMNNNGANIPIGTPFTLTATATDANGDALTYNWEGWDRTATGGAWNSGANSTTAPLFKSRAPKTTGSRTFPDMSIILAGYPANPGATMGGLKGETLPQVARAMNFKLTVRDNRAGGGGVVSGGDGCQTGFTGLFTINTVAGTGPFVVTAPNGGENYPGGSTQTITWNVAGTNAAPISTANVKISLSTDGGLTYPTVLSASTPNDGSEALTIPALNTTTARVKIEAVGNIYFDISNSNFSISGPSFTFDSPAATNVGCNGPATATATLGTIPTGGFNTPINLSATSPAGTTVSFGSNPLTPGNSTTVTLNNANTLATGTYTITVTGTAGVLTQTRQLTFNVTPGTGPTITTQPASQTICEGGNASFTAASTGTNQWQVSTDGGVNWTSIGGATGNTFTLTNVAPGQSNFRYRILATNQCNVTTSNAAILTVQNATAITTQPLSNTVCAGSSNTFTAAASGTSLTYQWQLSTNGGTSFSNITGATSSSYTAANVNGTMNSYQYRVVASGTCGSATSTAATLTVITPSVTIASNTSAIFPGQTAEITATYPAPPPGSTVQVRWLLNGVIVADSNRNSITVPVGKIGEYKAEVIYSPANCSAISAPVTINAQQSDRLFIYPIPNNGRFNVSYYNTNGLATTQIVTLYDARGAMVYRKAFGNVTGFYTILDVQYFSPSSGIYLVVLSDAAGNKIATGKVLIQSK